MIQRVRRTCDMSLRDVLHSEMSNCCAHLKSWSARCNARENLDRVGVRANEIFMAKYSELRGGESKKSGSADEKKAPEEQQQMETKKESQYGRRIKYTELWLEQVREGV